MGFGDIGSFAQQAGAAAQQAAGAAQQAVDQAGAAAQQAMQGVQDIANAAQAAQNLVPSVPGSPASTIRPPTSPPIRPPTTPGSSRNGGAPVGQRNPAQGSTGTQADPALEAHFVVRYGTGSTSSRDGLTVGWFRECSGLQVEVEVLEYAEGGQNGFVHKIPGRLKYPNLVLKSGVTNVDNLTKWLLEVQEKWERHPITVELRNHRGQKVREWNFVDALPVKWSGPNLNRASNNIAVETIEFVHRGLSPAGR